MQPDLISKQGCSEVNKPFQNYIPCLHAVELPPTDCTLRSPRTTVHLLSTRISLPWRKNGCSGVSIQRYTPTEALPLLTYPGISQHSWQLKLGGKLHGLILIYARTEAWSSMDGGSACYTGNGAIQFGANSLVIGLCPRSRISWIQLRLTFRQTLIGAGLAREMPMKATYWGCESAGGSAAFSTTSRETAETTRGNKGTLLLIAHGTETPGMRRDTSKGRLKRDLPPAPRTPAHPPCRAALDP